MANSLDWHICVHSWCPNLQHHHLNTSLTEQLLKGTVDHNKNGSPSQKSEEYTLDDWIE